jgi:hypothetical protein
MARKIWQSMIATATAAVCLVIGPTAHAAVYYQSDFDPLGFAGKAVWKVNDNCLSSGLLPNGYQGVNLLAPGGCDVALYSLQVQLWEGGAANATAAAGDATLITVNFDSDIANPYVVAGIWVQGGELAGVDTFLIGPKYVDNRPAGTLHNNYGVQFTSAHSPLGLLAPWFGNSVPAIGNLPDPGAYLWEEGYNRLTRTLEWVGLCPENLWATFACAKEVVVTDNSSGYAPFVTGRAFFRIADPSLDTTVPEPGSLALLVGAFGAGWLTRRRKTAA